MKIFTLKNRLLAISLIIFVSALFIVSNYFIKISADSSKTDTIKLIMLDERGSESIIQLQGLADEIIAGEGKYALHDDLFEYVYDPKGFIIRATRSFDKTEDVYATMSQNQESLKTRALNLHLRNLMQWLTGENIVTYTLDPIGTKSFEIKEIINGNPTGRMTYVTFSEGGALIGVASVNKPISQDDLYKEEIISEQKAAEIAYADILRQFSLVLQNQEFAKVNWTSQKTTFNQRLVWTITFTDLIRSDLNTPDQNWGAMTTVDIQTGEILLRAYAS